MIPNIYLFLVILIFFGVESQSQCNRDPTTNCVVYDSLHLKNFDGSLLSYDSKCGYTLVSINSKGINLEINLLQNVQTLQVKYAEHVYDVKVAGAAIELKRDGNVQSIPHDLSGVSISKPGAMVIVEIKDLGLKIRYDGRTAEVIQRNQFNDRAMLGMCGNNDGCSGNDMVMKNGGIAGNNLQFADSWSIGGCRSGNYLNSCGTNGRFYAQAQNFCNNLFSNQKFTKCSAFNSQFMNICTSNYCSCKLANRNDCMCDMLDVYARSCQIKTNDIIDWRSSTLCPINCRNQEQQYMTCAPNKRQLSCNEIETDTSNLDCEEGCYCPNGLRLQEDRCLFVEECDCYYNNVAYKPGTSIAQECNTCTCTKGQWMCTTKICQVEAGCYADPHYTTFDGKKFDFMGKCMYYVVRGNGFDVICDHYIWNGAFVKDEKSSIPSYCAKVIVQLRDDIIELEQGRKVKLNGFRLERLPFNSPLFRITEPSSQLVSVSLRNNVDVNFNGDSWLLVKIPTTMIGRVSGLFGTYTKSQDDDFLMANGSLTTDPNLFGHSWKVPGSCANEYTGPVYHPCSINPENREKAEQACAPLKSNLFADCLEDIETNYENCIYDGCECVDKVKTCVCNFYALQAAKCAAKGKPVDWRKTITQCQVQCPAGQTYQTCGNSCTRSCDDIGANPTCESSCVEGCNCPEGQTLNEKNQCIPINKCTCVWEDGRYNPETTFITGENKCTCSNGKWNIITTTPDDKSKYPDLNDLKKQCNADDFMTYTGCKRVNTVTCLNKHLNEDPNYNNCQSGCQCSEGFVFDEELNTCVRPEDCPCMYKGISYADKTTRNDRNQTCVCKDGFWACNPSADHWEKCSIWNNVHIRTFDETVYSFKGNCEYTLFEHSLPTGGVFRVTVTTGQCNVGSCIKSAKIYYKDATGREDIVTFVAGQEFVRPGLLANLVITDLDLSVMVDVIGMGIRVVWNKGGWLHVHVSRVWVTWNHVGLCGKYDDNPNNDLTTPNNQNGVTQLVDYYRVDKSCPGCTQLKEVNLMPKDNPCEILYSNVFKTCRYLTSVNEYYNRCLIDASLQLLIPENQRYNYYCQTLSAYAQECNDVNEPVQWRTNDICPYNCKPNKAYYPCETPCPKDTCEKDSNCPDRLCSEACNVPPCPFNSIYKDSTYTQCVPKDQCGSQTTATVEGHCMGDPHCTTFDGKYYDFMGKCMYYLVRGNGFDVICDNYIWNGAYIKDVKSTAPSSCAKVFIITQGHNIELEQKLNVVVDGQKLDWLPYVSQDFSVIQTSSEQITVSLKNSVVVLWNGNSYVTVRIPVTMIGQVKGLLGTYTKTQDDDFLMPNGIVTNDPNIFGNSWKVPGSCEGEYTGPVHHPCSINPDKRVQAEKSCAALKSDLFADCLENVNEVYENCLYDNCQCTNEQSTCVCEFYSSQGNKCAAKGKYVDWRKNVTECSIKCPSDQSYQVCGNSCTRSCEDIAANPTCQRQCVDGCNCPNGQTLDGNNRCIPISRCPCKWGNERYPPGFSFINGDDKWTCTDATWIITTATPEDKGKDPTPDDLKTKCDANKFYVYSGCKRVNVLTCQNKHLNSKPNYDNCESGCQCMEGYVLDTESNQCVKPSDCPCLHNGVSYPENFERNERQRTCVCKNGGWDCNTLSEYWEKCSVWSNVHVRTFDELVYSFKGNCEYTLFESSLSESSVLVRVTLKTVECSSGSCIKNVKIYCEDVNGNQDHVVFTNGETFVRPNQLNHLVITDLDLSIMVDVIKMGVRLVWNKGGWVHIHVSRIWTTMNQVGLCGRYDNNPNNDLDTPNFKNSVKEAVDYYRLDKTCPGSSELPNVNILVPENTCDILFSEAFKKCRLIKPIDEYYRRCLIDANTQLLKPENERTNYYCQTLSAYAQECNDIKQPVNWRTNRICPYGCKTNTVYYPCETPCPKDTCQSNVNCLDKVCSEACNVAPCPFNTIYKDSTYKQCVKRDECNGVINVPTVEGHCVGDPHCKTFDGKKFDFMGKCTYYLVRGNNFDVMCDHYIWKNGAFVKDYKSKAPSYCAKVIIHSGGNIIELEQKHNVKVNGHTIGFRPYINSEFRINQPSSELTTVLLNGHVTVTWNGNSRVTVSIPTTMIGKVNGLLGTFTKSQDDDFLMPNGVITKDSTEFGNSWKVPGSCKDEYTGPVEHPCVANPNRKAKAEESCAALKSDLFKGCLDDVNSVYDDCLYDACQCTDEQKTCVCEFYSIQSDECAAKGINVDWRNKIAQCALQCPAGQTYQVCANPCTRTCEDVSTSLTCRRICVDGCSCPEGQTLNSINQCVPINTCPCIWENKRYPPDFTFIHGDKLRVCKNAIWNVTTATPDDKTKYPTTTELNKKCSSNDNLEYSGCKRVNPVTCQNKHLNEKPNYENCHSGCQCEEGTVYDTEEKICVYPEFCPCLYKGISFPDKTERHERNQKCTCHGGAWSCSPEADHWEKCSVWNNIHVRTFDELIYSFKGICEYTLLEHSSLTYGVFRVTLTTTQCNVGSCIKSVKVYIRDSKGNEDNVILVTGEEFIRPNKLNNLVITNMELSIMVDVIGMGVRVVWNKSGWVHIHVSRSWTTRNHLGLCGKYDDNPKNDLDTPASVSDVPEFVDYYRVDRTCPRSSEIEKVTLIDNFCDILYSEKFETCRLLKPVEEYYNRCLINANLQLSIPENQRTNYYCQTLSAYAQECNDVGVPVNWRTNTICPYQCHNDNAYYSCDTPCPIETCQKSVKCPDKVCAEACNSKPCPPNMIYKDSTYKECVPKDVCQGRDCNSGCICQPPNDNGSNNIDLYAGCKDGKCSWSQLIFNIYNTATSQ
nr:IgGFc-binding protein-like [Onthophagus taurus]